MTSERRKVMHLKRGSILVGTAITLVVIVAPSLAVSSKEQPLRRRVIRKDSFNLRFDLTIKSEGTGEIYFHSDSPGNGCISTDRNGIMVSRVKITYENETGKALVVR